MEENVDYKELYLKMVRASEKAVRLLIQAQQECEEFLLCGEEEDDTVSEGNESVKNSR